MLACWIGPARVAGALVGTAVGLGLMLALVSVRDGMGVWDLLVAGVTLGAMAFGADAVGGVGGLTGSAAAVPLTLTVAAFAVGIWVFRRTTEAHRRALTGLLDAVRTAVLTSISLTLFTLIFKTDLGDGRSGAGSLRAFVTSLLLCVVVLGLTVLSRRNWLQHPRTRQVHDWVRGPLAGLAWLLLFLPVAGVIAALAVLLFGEGEGTLTAAWSGADWRALVAAVIAFAGNVGVWALTLGSLARLGIFGEAADFVNALPGLLQGVDLGDLPTSAGLGFFTHDLHEPGLWVCVALAPLALALAAAGALRSGLLVGRPLHGLAVWVVSLLAALPLLFRAANVHVTVDAGLLGEIGGGLGTLGLPATFLLVAYAAIVAVAAGLVVLVRSGCGAMARSVQGGD